MKPILLFLICGWLMHAGAMAKGIDSLDLYYKKGMKAMEQNGSDEAKRCFERYIALSLSNDRSNDFRYSEVVNGMAHIAESRGDMDEAIRLMSEVIAVRKKAKDCLKSNLASALNEQAIYYSRKADYDEAIDLETEAVSLYKQTVGEKHRFYAVALNNLAAFYFSRGNPDDNEKAIELEEQALRNIQKKTKEHVDALNSLVVYYSQVGHLEKANDYGKRVLKMGKKLFGSSGTEYAAILNNQAIRLAHTGNYTQAIDFSEVARTILEADTVQHHSLLYAKTLSNLSTFYSHSEKYATAMRLLEKALPIFKQIEGEKGADYVRCLTDLSAIYTHSSDLGKADDYARLARDIWGRSADKSNPQYGKMLSKQAEPFAATGNYAKAIEMEMEALGVFEACRDTMDMALTLNRLSNYHYHQGDIGIAISLCSKSLDIYKQRNKLNPAYARVCNNMSLYKYSEEDYPVALAYGLEAEKIYRQQGETNNSFYAKILANVALYYFVCDSLQQAISYSEQACDLQLRILGEEHPDNVILFYNLANFYYKKGNVEKLQHYYRRALSLQARYVRNNFSHLTTAGREMYWNMKSYVFRVAPAFAFLAENNDDLAADAYNALLFTKGILLNSEIDFKNLLMQTGDFRLIDKYESLGRLNKRIEDYYKSYSNDLSVEIDSLKEVAASLERELVKGCKEYGDFTDNLSIAYSRITERLGDDDVAIEFLDVNTANTGKAYAALCLRKGWDAPKLVKLFTNKDLFKLSYDGRTFFEALRCQEGINGIFNDSIVGRMVWEPLENTWGEGVRNVYFAPSGLIYQWGIEYLRCDSLSRICDHYTLHRLSSTKMLGQPQKQSEITAATVYGGLVYEMNLAEMQQEHDKYKDYDWLALSSTDEESRRSLFDADCMATDSLLTRGNVSFLKGTMMEAELIGEQLMQHEVPTNMFLLTEGTEESFKALSGKRQSLLHIATHGFCFSEQEVERNKQVLSFIEEGVGNTKEDHSMNYSGLLFAGSNNILSGKELPEGVENGVLTAKEISQMDFRGLDLVVLSACQTGLGEVKEDGVFGLQRGFKKSGAKTLIMSLWTVDDKATQIMMTGFYSALMEGHSLYDAFRFGQLQVRKSGFTDPYYWASFIMLDGMK